MTDMRFALAPAGVPAWGGPDVRPAAGGAVVTVRLRYAAVRSVTPSEVSVTATTGATTGAMAGVTAPFQGTGLPTGGRLTEQFGSPVPATCIPATDVPATELTGTDAQRTDFQHNGTTLGIHSPGRPQS
jgi:hypothetical protein